MKSLSPRAFAATSLVVAKARKWRCQSRLTQADHARNARELARINARVDLSDQQKVPQFDTAHLAKVQQILVVWLQGGSAT